MTFKHWCFLLGTSSAEELNADDGNQAEDSDDDNAADNHNDDVCVVAFARMLLTTCSQ